ncbi:MAG: glycerate kinase [Bacteroidota bacterium]
MKILIAPNNFKESISASGAAAAIDSGIRSTFSAADTFCLPLSDGGEGFVDALVNATSGTKINCRALDPLGRTISGYYGQIDKKTAVIEMALVSGLERLKENEKNPWLTTTYGTGQLVKDAIEKGFNRIIMGIGGSATNDAGMGMLQALGVEFYTQSGDLITGSGAQYLPEVDCIDPDGLEKSIKGISFVVACDVTNPLFGQQGATYVYGPQKGADPDLLSTLENSVLHFHQKSMKQLKIDKSGRPGAGAAGGIGYAMMAYLNAEMQPGFDLVAKHTFLEEKVKWADLIITGEGKIDDQTIRGKVISRLANLTRKHSKRLLVFGGMVENTVVIDGVERYFSILEDAKDETDSMKNAARYLSKMAAELRFL